MMRSGREKVCPLFRPSSTSKRHLNITSSLTGKTRCSNMGRILSASQSWSAWPCAVTACLAVSTGQGTHPANIARALKQDFSEKPDIAQRQRIAVAHINAEREMEAAHAPESHVLTSTFLQRADGSLYVRLAPADRMSPNERVITPGTLRQADITLGRHHPPGYASVPAFLARADEVYGPATGLDSLLNTIAAAYHRFAWVHPFLDGNGRACRLQTHCALLPLSDGLWSVNRGLARQQARYYELLANADMPRHGDLDGRDREKMLRA